MINFDLNRMLYTLTPDEHDYETVKNRLAAHPEVRFVSFTGVDMGGHNTDEKIPVSAFIGDMDKMMAEGVQTDGSSVALPTIADLSNARVDIMPDPDVNWYVEYNFNNMDYETGLPTGTLRIPSFLRHNGDTMVGSRTYLKECVDRFKAGFEEVLKANPYVFKHIGGIDSLDEIDELLLTNATELEFWVKTPDDRADRNQLSIAQELKEQYWKRVTGPVGTAMEQTLEILEHYGFGVEMGHKEVGGVKAKMGNSGTFDHIMEQLEIDWKYSNPMQAADNESQVKNIVRDVFRMNSLEVTFRAKPMHGVAGSGEHTHFGLAARLKSGKVINLFEAANRDEDFMSPVGYGALMGILRNYEILNPIVSSTHDAFQRLKPGYEAPICIVTSLGVDNKTPSRNRTILIGLVRDLKNPMSTRFELRSPNPHTNTYLVIGATYLTMLDGIRAALEAGKTPKQLEASISKPYGKKDFYLEKNREYRSERNVYTDYTREEREKLFGTPPANVWQCFSAWGGLDDPIGNIGIITGGDETIAMILRSYREQMILKWSMEYHDRYIENTMDFLRRCTRLHEDDTNEYDANNWKEIVALKDLIGHEINGRASLLMQARIAIDNHDYEELSRLEIIIEEKIEELRDVYNKYKRNIL
ncbi:MAG: glutamine synthetase [Mogibacterium sp.]|nr:glutamine synthetase [Mogibacterium sp.]MBR2540467.1 glutamine synthetase [Mogibacterium sp.]